VSEQEWLACTDPQKMLELLRGKASGRKLRLFACACCRHIWPLLADPRSRHAVDLAERYADGLATEEERDRAAAEAWEVDVTDNDLAARAAIIAADLPDCEWGSATGVAANAAFAVGRRAGGHTARIGEQRVQCHLLRDLFGPLRCRPVALDPAWLTWQGSTIRNLAQAVYEERSLPSGTLESGRLAVLADALEEAGCHAADIVGHCRQPGPHVRGCWVLDLLLGKG
jgi:hypothetical protein